MDNLLEQEAFFSKEAEFQKMVAEDFGFFKNPFDKAKKLDYDPVW